VAVRRKFENHEMLTLSYRDYTVNDPSHKLFHVPCSIFPTRVYCCIVVTILKLVVHPVSNGKLRILLKQRLWTVITLQLWWYHSLSKEYLIFIIFSEFVSSSIFRRLVVVTDVFIYRCLIMVTVVRIECGTAC